MPLYLNELAPWERKQEYYHTIQLGKDVKEQTSVLNKQTKAMIVSQLASTNAIIASQERTSEGMDAVVCGVERVEQGIFELKSSFEWGISEVVWQIEQNRAVLRDILEVLMAPLDTQAKERRKRAEDAYANGWIEDAEEEFLESEKLNKFDFSIHISLGMIYLFKIVDKEKALSYFEKAIKYSKPKSAFHASYALLHKALIHYDMGNTQEAEKASYEAITLSPNFTEAFYQNAQYNAQLKKKDNSLSYLEKAIKIDKLYCLKANTDQMFDPIRKEVNILFEKIRNKEKDICSENIINIRKIQNNISAIVKPLMEEEDAIVDNKFLKEQSDYELKAINNLTSRNSLFDYIEANNKIFTLHQNMMKTVEDILSSIKCIVKTKTDNISSLNSKHSIEKNKKDGQVGAIAILIASFIGVYIILSAFISSWGWKVGISLPIALVITGGLDTLSNKLGEKLVSNEMPEEIITLKKELVFLTSCVDKLSCIGNQD